jgi:predicted alpha/beta-fold hydrolase
MRDVPAHDEAEGTAAGAASGPVRSRAAAGCAHVVRVRQRVHAPLHGFRGTDDYWARASAKPHLARIRVPTLALNARNDPFVPTASLPRADAVGSHVTLWQPAHGGHVGFPGGTFPGHLMTLPDAVMGWMREAR